jgi:hypothetical protein
MRVSAPIKSRAAPAIEIEAIIPSAVDELRFLHGTEIGGRFAELRQRHRLQPAHHQHARSGRGAQSERQPKLPHHILAIEMSTMVLGCLAAANANARPCAPVPFDRTPGKHLHVLLA